MLGILLALSKSGMSSLEVTSPISLSPTLSSITEVMTYNNEEIKDENIYVS